MRGGNADDQDVSRGGLGWFVSKVNVKLKKIFHIHTCIQNHGDDNRGHKQR